ncbi:MAG: ABC transporter permease [Coraliomargaritaceae bacterium]
MKLSRQIFVAWKMLSFRVNRLLFSAFGIAFSVVIIFMQMGFFNGLNDSQANLPPKLLGDLVISSPEKKHLKSSRTIFSKIPEQVWQIEGVRDIRHLYFKANYWINPEDNTANRVLYIGVDLEKPMISIPEIDLYREQLKLPNTMLYDKKSRRELGNISIGSDVRIGAKQDFFKVVGFFELGPNISYEGHVIMSMDNFLQANPRKTLTQPDQRVDLALIELQPEADPELVRREILNYMKGDFFIHTPEELFRREVMTTIKSTPSGFILGVSLLVGLVIGIIICYQILFNEVTDNIAQFAMIKAMGYSSSVLTGIVLSCAMILGTIGFVLGILGSVGLYELIEKLTQLAMHLSVERIILVYVLTLFMCVCSGLLALKKVIKADPAELY